MMNEQIKELWAQASIQKAVKGDTRATWEVFAELIVRECAGIYSKIDNGNLHMGTDDYLEALHKTFFGVEQ
jgi:hypothetical protein